MKKFLSIIITSILFFTRVVPIFAVYEKYINTLPTPVLITQDKQDIKQELESKVQEIVSSGHMAPTVYFNGGEARFTNNSSGVIYFMTPNETLYTLSAAYPYVSSILQTSIKTYLTSENSKYSPFTVGNYDRTDGNLTSWSGARREYFPLDNTYFINFWPGVSVNQSVLYSVWAYCYYTNNWTYASSNYNAMKSMYTSMKNAGAVNTYAKLSGVVGFARIAKQLNNTADYNDALSYAEQGFATASNFDQFLANAKTLYPNGSQGYVTPVFLFNRNPVGTHFNRDIGLFLRENAQAPAQTYANQIEKDAPAWWLTDGAMTWGENAYATPVVSWTGFMLHSYILNENVDQLKKYWDQPSRKGDLLYIQKLVAMLEAPSSNITPTVSLTPIPKLGDANGDGKVDGVDYITWLNHYNQTITEVSNGDFNSDGKVDGVDYITWLTNYGS